MKVKKFGNVYEVGPDGVGYIENDEGIWFSFYLEPSKISNLIGKEGLGVVYTLDNSGKVIDVQPTI